MIYVSLESFTVLEVAVGMAEKHGIALPRRETRGKRMTRLLDDEVEADEQFWNQEAFQEAVEDLEYEEEGEVEDVFDSDFDEEEAVSDGEPGEEEKRPKQKRKLPPGSKKTVKKSKLPKAARNLTALEEAVEAAADGQGASPRKSTKKHKGQMEIEQLGGSLEGDTSVQNERRKSSRTAVVVKAIEREAVRAAQTPKVVKKRREEERRWTQEEMLLEAAQTEVLNRQSLELMLAKEEEVKRKANIQKEVYEGPVVRFHSKTGLNILSFTCASEVPEAINSKAPPYPKRTLCAVTGLPAKYRDPLTGLPYATKEAFHIIRERSSGENVHSDIASDFVSKRRGKFQREKSGGISGTVVQGRMRVVGDFRM